jgi:hypothetical protein
MAKKNPKFLYNFKLDSHHLLNIQLLTRICRLGEEIAQFPRGDKKTI